uniref:F5/8 type C domain-containing protein n=1 Tax=Megaselia scalaris TaxID=36166 RepID=T1GS57_MEGSC
GKKRNHPPYLTNELLSLRKLLRAQFNKSFTDGDWSTYKALLKWYTKAKKAAQRESGRKLCESIESVSDMSRLRKVLAKTHTSPSFIKNNKGNWTDSSLEINRLKIDNNGGAWCPKHMVSRALKEYIQIDLVKVHAITSILTQGRFGKGQGQEYTEAFNFNSQVLLKRLLKIWAKTGMSTFANLGLLTVLLLASFLNFHSTQFNCSSILKVSSGSVA